MDDPDFPAVDSEGICWQGTWYRRELALSTEGAIASWWREGYLATKRFGRGETREAARRDLVVKLQGFDPWALPIDARGCD